MNPSDYPPAYFEKNGFTKIDESIIKGGQAIAEKVFNAASFKPARTNCVIVFKQNANLYGQVKRDYNSAIKQAKSLMEVGINSIIYIFTNYPHTVKHHIVSEDAFTIEDYNGKGSTLMVDVTNIKTVSPNPEDN